MKPANIRRRRARDSALHLVAPAESDVGREPTEAPLDMSLEALYERYAPYVGAVASRILGRATEVDDVVQEVFTRAARLLRRRENRHEVQGWLATVTVRLCVKELRLRRIWSLLDLAADPSYDRLAAPGAGPEERQLIVEVYHALDRVPARERVAWALRYVEGESLERVASLCDCSLATAKRRIADAHDRIRRQLDGGTHG